MPKTTVQVGWSNPKLEELSLDRIAEALSEMFYHFDGQVMFVVERVPDHNDVEPTFKCLFCRGVKPIVEARFDPTDDYWEANGFVCVDCEGKLESGEIDW